MPMKAISGACTVLAALAAGPSAYGSATMLGTPPEEVIETLPEYKFSGPAPLPLRKAREDWAFARHRLATEPAVADFVARRQRDLAAWIARGGDRANWIGGWQHDYIDPAKGIPRKWSPQDAEPAQTNDAGQKVHRAWVSYRRNKNIKMMLEAARLWKLTGDVASRDWAADQLDLYARAYAAWPEQHQNGIARMFANNLAEAVAATSLTEVARLVGSDVPATRRKTWQAALFQPMLENVEKSNRGRNNIAVWQAVAAAELALELGDDAAWQRAINGKTGVKAMLAKGVTRDYLWFEPSLGYGIYMQQALSDLFVAASVAGREQQLRQAMLLTQTMIAAQASMRFSDGTLPAFGDTPADQAAFDNFRLAQSQRTMPLRVPSVGLQWQTLIDPDIPFAPLPDETRSRYWPEREAAMLRADGWELFTQWGQATASHAQGDALSYDLRYRGVVLTEAVGVAAYGSRLFLDYLRRSAAHNMPIIDGQGQIKPQRGSLEESDPAGLTMANAGFPLKSRIERQIRVEAGSAAIKTRLAGADGQTHRLGDVFNTHCAVKPAAGLTNAASPAGDGFDWWRQVRVSQPARTFAVQLGCKGGSFDLAIETSVPARLYVASAPDAKGAYSRTALYVETSSRALEVTSRFSPR